MSSSKAAFLATQEVLSRQIPALDGVRGVAVLLVLFIHFGQGWPVTTELDLLPRWFFGFGWAGVDLFFVLSGFLITGILIDTRAAPNYFRAFYARRFLRIFPLYYAFLAAWFIVAPEVMGRLGLTPTVDFGTGRSAWYWAYLSNWLPLGKEVADIRYMWSLAVEEQFYLCWPLVVMWVPGRRLGWLCLGLTAAALGIRYGLLRAGVNWFAAYATTPARMDTLALGALVAVAVRDERWHRLLSRTWAPVTALSGLGALLVFVVAGGPHQWHPLVQTWGYTLIALGFAGAMAGVVLRGGRLLELSPLRAFGRYSYAIYVLQGVALSILSALVLPDHQDLLQSRVTYFFLYLVVGIALTYAMALASWHLLEKRFLGLKRYFVAERSPRAPAN